MKLLLFFTLFLILITFSIHQNVIAETEEQKEREIAVKEASNSLKREITRDGTEKITSEPEKDEIKTKQKLGKMKKLLPAQEEFDEITLRTVWKYVDKQSSSNEEYEIESIQGLLRDVGRVYDPIVNKYKVATIQIEIIKYEDNEKLRNYWINEKKSNLEFMFENAYLVGMPYKNIKCFFNYTNEGAITICITDEYLIQSIIFDKYHEHFPYSKSKTGSNKLELNQEEMTTNIVELVLEKILKQEETKNQDQLFEILESNRKIKEKELNENNNDVKNNQDQSFDPEKDKKYGIQKFSCVRDEFGLTTISGQFNNDQNKKDKVILEVAFLNHAGEIIYKNTANLLQIDEFETKRFLGNLKIDKNFLTCTIKIKN
ncbi:MAG TPA: hypothetical protein QF656_00105 [Nitrosopumilus sp.]|mgnify:CR=1 FL=1|nr:hypothetical protein [Nitrosopumilus sp.]